MDRFLASTIPTALYIRALVLQLVPRRLHDLAPYALPSFYYGKGPVLYAHSIALLAAADLSPDQRERVERGALARARRASSHPEQGADAYHELVPYLSPPQRELALASAQSVLGALERYVLERPWSAPWGSLLRFRDRWRVLSPDTYPDWLKRQLAALRRFNAWHKTPAGYRERLAHLHLLSDYDRLHALDDILEGIRMVGDDDVTRDRESAFAGGRLYRDEDAAAATHAAQIEALTAISPILPWAYRARAHELAKERSYDLGDLPGRSFADPLWMSGVIWYSALTDDPVPWFTQFERQRAFKALDVGTRDALIRRFVEDYVQLAQDFLSNPSQRAVAGDPIAGRFRRLVGEDLVVAAPYLDVEQTRCLLALYQQEERG